MLITYSYYFIINNSYQFHTLNDFVNGYKFNPDSLSSVI